jgi:hypothetical protein
LAVPSTETDHSPDLTRSEILACLRERIVRFAASRYAREGAEDLAQEVLVVIHEKYSHLERLEDLVPLSLQILRFKLFAQRRKAVRHGEYTQVSVDEYPLHGDAPNAGQAHRRDRPDGAAMPGALPTQAAGTNVSRDTGAHGGSDLEHRLHLGSSLSQAIAGADGREVGAMNRPAAEKLLGGYAAGILTDSEKRTLFATALKQQDLFDALMDEEALRELLADPEARERLLAVLAQTERSQRPVPTFWRRPAVLGLVASLFALVTTSYVVLRHPDSTLADQKMIQPPSPVGPTSKAGSVSQDKAPTVVSSQGAASLAKAKVPVLTAPQNQSALALSTTQKDAGKGQEMEAKAARSDQVGLAAAPAPEMPRAAERRDVPPSLAEAFSDSSGPAASGLPVVSELAARKSVKSEARKETESSEARVEASLLQVFPLEHLRGGRARLKVSWGLHGHLYALKRSPAGVVLLSPGKISPGTTGTQTTTFEFPLREHDLLDVYVLRSPENDPASLPASEDVPGEWRRIFPE